MRVRLSAFLFLPAALLLTAGCGRDEDPTVLASVTTQPMPPQGSDGAGEDSPGLEEMPDDGQGIIYF